MIHYIYKTTSKSGKYYVGRHSTKNINDSYFGSGKWIRSIKDKSSLKKEILKIFNSFDELLIEEKKLLQEVIGDPLNMNFNNSSCGFGTGSMNPSHKEEVKNKLRERMKTDNPMKNGHSQESKERIRQSTLGNKNHFYGKTHSEETKERIRNSQTGTKWTEDQKQRLSETRKKQHNGRRPKNLIFTNHTNESKNKIRQSALNRKKLRCPNCQKCCAPHVAKRWHFENCIKRTEMGIS